MNRKTELEIELEQVRKTIEQSRETNRRLNRRNQELESVQVDRSFQAYLKTIKQNRIMRDALRKIASIRNGSHPDGSAGKCTDMWKVAETTLQGVGEIQTGVRGER